MQRFAIIESNSGFVWGVVDAESALAACSVVDNEIGGRPATGFYEPASESELRTTRVVYDVREAPEGFNVDDGQDPEQIAAVEALPRAGLFGWVRFAGAGDRVEGGQGEDYDTGRVESVEADGSCVVAWDSGVKTRATLAALEVID